MSSRVSVVIPLFNRARFIVETLESIAAQTTPPHEVIVIDDASTDESVAVVERYRQQTSLPLKVFPNVRKKGVSGATNTGMKIATGDLIALQDSDDLWKPNHLSQLTEVLNRHGDVDIAFSAVDFFGDGPDMEANSVQFKASVQKLLAAAFEKSSADTWLSTDKLLESILEVGFPFRCQASVMRRSMIERTGLLFDDDLGFTQDSHFMTLAASHCRFAYVELLGAAIRRHEENASAAYYGDKIVKSYGLRARRLKDEFAQRSLSESQRKALSHRIWSLQSDVMWIQSRGKPINLRLQQCLLLLEVAPSLASVKSCIKNLVRPQ